uniref:Reverse transcriptase domain-containing protein n=1 Tax=Plectus sambesii TaxID=2011161 RepID=A0A914W7K9_9BILA
MKQHHFYVCTCNSQPRLAEFEAEAQRINFKIIGLPETRKSGSGRIDLPSGYTLYYVGEDNNKINAGVGFYVPISLNKDVVSFKPISARVAQLTVRLHGSRTLRLIQVHAPHSAHNDVDYETFLDDISALLSVEQATRTIVMGDFNAKIGQQQDNEQTVGSHGLGDRNERGQKLVDFCEDHGLYVLNTFYQKKPQRRWTWQSPNGATRNEIDYMLSFHQTVATDVTVLNRFNAGSYHRLIRTTLATIPRRRKSTPHRNRTVFNRDVYKTELSRLLTATTPSDDPQSEFSRINSAIFNASQAAKILQPLPKRRSDATLTLLHVQRQFKVELGSAVKLIEYSELCKLVRKCIEDDLAQHHLRLLLEAVETGKLRRARSELASGRRQIIRVRKSDATMATSTKDVEKQVKHFYETLYRTSNPIAASHTTPDDDNDPFLPFLESEIHEVLKDVKVGKAPGPDGIVPEALYHGREILAKPLTDLFNKFIDTRAVPPGFDDSKTLLLYKKGDECDIRNYRPISLLPVTYKAFTKTIHNRIQATLDAAQPPEQAGFRKYFSTTDHLQALNEIYERAAEYKFPLYAAFIDYEKAFDSIEHNAIWEALRTQGVHSTVIATLQSIYSTARSTFHFASTATEVEIQRGVRQGDTLSPKLFTACLQGVFDRLEWSAKGIRVDGRLLSHLMFADDIVILSHDFD